LAGDPNTKQSFWNSGVSNPSGGNLAALFDSKEFEVSATQCPNHYSPVGNGDVLDIVVYQNIRVSDVTVSDILESGHLPVVSHILDHGKIRNLSELVEKLQSGIGFKALPQN
jgi:hypothetical protein